MAQNKTKEHTKTQKVLRPRCVIDFAVRHSSATRCHWWAKARKSFAATGSDAPGSQAARRLGVTVPYCQADDTVQVPHALINLGSLKTSRFRHNLYCLPKMALLT